MTARRNPLELLAVSTFFTPKSARISWMQNINMREPNDRSGHLKAGIADYSADRPFYSVLGTRNNLAVKVRYRLGSRNC